MKNILSVEKIEKYYGNKDNVTKAIDNISFKVDEGEFVGIMGPSGSGKTTLLNCISTIDTVTTGNIIINGKDITKLNSNDRAHGYNITSGGQGMCGFKLSNETKEKISKANRGRKISQETIEKIRQGNIGKKLSELTLKRRSEYFKNTPPKDISITKTVYQFTKDGVYLIALLYWGRGGCKGLLFLLYRVRPRKWIVLFTGIWAVSLMWMHWLARQRRMIHCWLPSGRALPPPINSFFVSMTRY